MKISVATLTAIAGFVGAGVSLGAQAQILKCVDKNGRVEFATSCPAGTQQQNTGVSNKPALAPAAKVDATDAKANPAAPKSLAERDAEYRKRQAAQKEADIKAAQKTAEDADRQRACQSAQSNLRALKDRQRMYRSDPKTGERIVYEETDYQREIPLTERQIADYCKT